MVIEAQPHPHMREAARRRGLATKRRFTLILLLGME
jgi:hypothetical protein